MLHKLTLHLFVRPSTFPLLHRILFMDSLSNCLSYQMDFCSITFNSTPANSDPLTDVYMYLYIYLCQSFTFHALVNKIFMRFQLSYITQRKFHNYNRIENKINITQANLLCILKKEFVTFQIHANLLFSQLSAISRATKLMKY